MTAAIRLHRWIRTLDFYRRAIRGCAERPALIHCNDYNTMWVGVAARAMGGIAVLYDSHELWPDRNLRPEPRWWLLACESLFVRCAHVTITASPGYAEVMARRYRIDRPKVVRNIPASRPGGAAAQAGDPAQASGGTKHSLALYVGALTSGRGIEISIKALALVPDARLKLVGPGRDDYRAGLVELARREGVADRVEFAGAVPPEKLLGAIGEASVGLALIQPVCLSYEMSLPNKLFEYVAAGIPVLGSDLPAIGALVREHEIGLVAQPDQVADVASKLSAMLEPQRNAAFRLATRKAAKRLNWELSRGFWSPLTSRLQPPRDNGRSASAMEAPSSRVRPRLSRTFSRGRWSEYRRFLELAGRHGYRIVSLEQLDREGRRDGVAPTLILRHDVDQHPRSALTMAAIEDELGVRSSWYFRWRTAHPRSCPRLRNAASRSACITRH